MQARPSGRPFPMVNDRGLEGSALSGGGESLCRGNCGLWGVVTLSAPHVILSAPHVILGTPPTSP
jgi:hypothetical protein